MVLDIIASLKEIVNLIDTHSTFVLAIVTIMYMILTYNLSRESRNERKYQYLQKRLEYLYFPLREIFSSYFDLSIRIKPEERQFVHIRIIETKRPIILTSRHINEKFEEIKPYLYMAPPTFKEKIDNWAKRISDIEYTDKCWSEEEVTNIVTELGTRFEDIFEKINEYIKKDERELYYIANGYYMSYLIRIKDYTKDTFGVNLEMLLGATVFFIIGLWLLLGISGFSTYFT
jgi:hypothetical protein